MGVTYWDTAKALAASEQIGILSRTQAAKSVPGTQVVNLERGELMTMDRADAPKAGSSIRLVTIYATASLACLNLPWWLRSHFQEGRAGRVPSFLQKWRRFSARHEHLRRSSQRLVGCAWRRASERAAGLEVGEGLRLGVGARDQRSRAQALALPASLLVSRESKERLMSWCWNTVPPMAWKSESRRSRSSQSLRHRWLRR